MRINKVLCSPGLTGFYADDKEAIRQGAKMDGFVYRGEPMTKGFKSIRQPGESVSIMFVLDSGEITYGDCAIAQYTGSGGREVPNTAKALIEVIKEHVVPYFEGRELKNFKAEAEEIDKKLFDGDRLPASIRYGVTQAILETVAKKRNITMAEVIAEEYNLEIDLKPVLLNAQSGDERYTNVDKMILKKAGFMPHGLINNVEEKLGKNGEKLLDYVTWVRNRVLDIGDSDYQPIFRFDVYGTIGIAFDNDIAKITDYLVQLEKAAKPFEIYVEMPLDTGDNESQLKAMQEIRRRLRERGCPLKLIIDEYANTLEEIKEWVDAKATDMIQVKTIDLGGINNTVEATLYCKENNVLPYQGGTCNETDKSALVCVHLAIATQPFAMASKPGMGVDEGMMIVNNEMERVLTLLRARQEN